LLPAGAAASRWNQAAKTLFSVAARKHESPGDVKFVAQSFDKSDR
jgi:hypothetical protein